MSDQKLHPLAEPFKREETARWREREDIRDAVSEVRDTADEVWQLFEKFHQSEQELTQASVALREMEAAIQKLWPKVNL